jgi:hypothetical protein
LELEASSTENFFEKQESHITKLYWVNNIVEKFKDWRLQDKKNKVDCGFLSRKID